MKPDRAKFQTIRIDGVAYVHVQMASRKSTPEQLEGLMSNWISNWWATVQDVRVAGRLFQPRQELLRGPWAVASPYGVTMLLSIPDHEASQWKEWLTMEVLPKVEASFPDVTVGKFDIPAR